MRSQDFDFCRTLAASVVLRETRVAGPNYGASGSLFNQMADAEGLAPLRLLC
jgi:hypothetical protein